MSATMPNVDVVSRWLGAELYITQFRPVELKNYTLVCWGSCGLSVYVCVGGGGGGGGGLQCHVSRSPGTVPPFDWRHRASWPQLEGPLPGLNTRGLVYSY